MRAAASTRAAVVVREYCPAPLELPLPRWTVDAFLREDGVCGICGVDTRRITQLIRAQGRHERRRDATPSPTEALLGRVRAYRVTGVVDGGQL